MEASATTVNIEGPNILAEALASVEPEEPAPAETVTVPLKMLADMQAQIEELRGLKTVTQSGISLDQLMFLIQELKKPDEETQRKLADEKARREQERKNMIELAMLEEQKRLEREANCNHKKDNGRTAVVGQVHSDGFYHGICQHCQKAFTPTRPTTEMMQMGTG